MEQVLPAGEVQVQEEGWVEAAGVQAGWAAQGQALVLEESASAPIAVPQSPIRQGLHVTR